MGKKNVLLNIRMTEEEMSKLEYYCNLTRMSKSDFIRDALDLKYNIVDICAENGDLDY